MIVAIHPQTVSYLLNFYICFFFLEILNRFGFYHSTPPALTRINTIVEACRRSEYIFNRVMITGSLSLDRCKEQRRRLLFPD